MSIIRADDIGTQFPADVDDTAPDDPQLGRQEYDYSAGPEPRNLPASSALADVSAQITQYILSIVGNDTYFVKSLINGVEGSLEEIAKPWQLRRNIFEAGINGIIFEYETATFRKVTTVAGAESFEEIQPPYFTDAEIMYAAAVDATEVTGALKIELNTGAHHWAPVTGIRRARIIAVFDDYLECINVNESNINIGTDIFFIAKPTKLQKTPWEGKTVIVEVAQSILYTYLAIGKREAKLVGGSFADDKQEEIIVPNYGTTESGNGDIIHYAQVSSGTGITAPDPDDATATVKVIYVDLNIDSRAWVRNKVTT